MAEVITEKRPQATIPHYYDLTKKYAGLLAPVFALRHEKDLGIGDTHAVKDAIDFCAAHGFSLLQILPIHETVGDHSPYNAISAHALSPALLSLTEETVPGLTRAAIEEAAPENWLAHLRQGPVRHNSVQPLKMQILLGAHRHFAFATTPTPDAPLAKEFTRFKTDNATWLQPYTLYRLLIREYEGNPNWTEWRPEHQTHSAANAWLARHPDRAPLEFIREGYAYVQWIASRQWDDVRTYAETHGVYLMGEMSFGVGRCSSDVWAHPELFDLEWYVGAQAAAAWDTTKDAERWGQNWGFPAYRWENHRSTHFEWLRSRVAAERRYFHACRLDHVRGYFRAYMFPWSGGVRHAEYSKLTIDEVRERTGGRLPRYIPGADDDEHGRKLAELQGREILAEIKNEARDMYLVAEILGEVIDYMRQTLDDLHIGNLTFPPYRRRHDGTIPPVSSLRQLSLVAYSNHDQPPLASVYAHLQSDTRANPKGTSSDELRQLLKLARYPDDQPPPDTITDALLAGWMDTLMDSPCQLAVVMTSDLLGTTQRFNLPGSYGADTWCERLEFPLNQYTTHPLYAARIATLRQIIQDHNRIALHNENPQNILFNNNVPDSRNKT